MFLRNDLRNGDFVITRNKKIGQFLTTENGGGIVFERSSHPIGCWDENLFYTEKKEFEFDIMKVYRDPFSLNRRNFHKDDLVFDRDDALILTVKEIEEKFNVENLIIRELADIKNNRKNNHYYVIKTKLGYISNMKHNYDNDHKLINITEIEFSRDIEEAPIWGSIKNHDDYENLTFKLILEALKNEHNLNNFEIIILDR